MPANTSLLPSTHQAATSSFFKPVPQVLQYGKCTKFTVPHCLHEPNKCSPQWKQNFGVFWSGAASAGTAVK